MEYSGERIYLRILTLDDATERYASWLSDPEVNKFLATKSATVPELREYITQKNAKPDAELYGIFLHADDSHIGTVKLEPIDLVQQQATIGIMVGDKTQWGKGFAGEAMQLLIDDCFSRRKLGSVRLGVLAQNESALKAYKKLGFTEVNREVGGVVYPNGVFDQVEMILKNYA